MSGYERELATAEAAAREAGALLRAHFDQEQEVGYKGRIDLVTQMDLKSERLIVERLRAAFPGDDIWAEEGSGERRGAGRLWIVDPLDGTTNYAHGYPVFAVSIALRVEGRLVAGVVYNPLLEEMYAARLGGGATLNGRPRRVTAVASLERAMVATGFPYDMLRDDPEQSNVGPFSRFVVRSQAVRRAGSAALAIAKVAAGRTDGFWERGLHAWDMAAAALMVEEAGGRVTDYEGRPLVLEAGEIVATNGPLHEPMLEVLRLGAASPERP
jgi:myo-inositol-1(or 4)-monophosphatase